MENNRLYGNYNQVESNGCNTEKVTLATADSLSSLDHSTTPSPLFPLPPTTLNVDAGSCETVPEKKKKKNPKRGRRLKLRWKSNEIQEMSKDIDLDFGDNFCSNDEKEPEGLTSISVDFTEGVGANGTNGEEKVVDEKAEQRRLLWLERRRKFVKFCKRFLGFLLSTVGLTICMVFYTILGGFIFHSVESPNEIRIKHGVRSSLHEHVEKLWNLTEQLNILHKANWSIMAKQIVDNFTLVVFNATKKDGWDGRDQDAESDLQWSFAGSMLYSATVITTIGYGHIAPKTNSGRVITILYAIFGIPLCLMSIAHLGGFMATVFRFLYKNIFCGLFCVCFRRNKRTAQDDTAETTIVKSSEEGDPIARGTSSEWSAVKADKKKKNGKHCTGSEGASLIGNSTVELTTGSCSEADRAAAASSRAAFAAERLRQSYKIVVKWRRGVRNALFTEDNKAIQVPIYVSLLLIGGYISLGALMFGLWETEWNFLIGLYFCFVTLSTIGFGDYVPGTSLDPSSSQSKLVLCSMYLIVGLALLAMCFDLMQEEARAIFRSLGKKLGLTAPENPPSDEQLPVEDVSL